MLASNLLKVYDYIKDNIFNIDINFLTRDFPAGMMSGREDLIF